MVSCFSATSLKIFEKFSKKIEKYVIVNRQGHHNIRNGIVWAHTGHSTGTCTATLCVVEHTEKFESFQK